MCTPVLIDNHVKNIDIIVAADLSISTTCELSSYRQVIHNSGRPLRVLKGENSCTQRFVCITFRRSSTILLFLSKF
jgi:hypothetical protein